MGMEPTQRGQDRTLWPDDSGEHHEHLADPGPRRGLGASPDEVDRAIGALASEQNVLDQKVRANLPSPEVVYLEFWYFDGLQWYDLRTARHKAACRWR